MVSPSAYCQGQNSFAYLGTAAYELPISNKPEPFFWENANDRWGKSVTLFGRTDPGLIVTQVVLSEVYAALGLDHVPVHPTFGTTQKPNWSPASVEELQTEWFVAAVTPHLWEMDSPPPSEPSWAAIEQQAIMAWLDVAFMTSGRVERWVDGLPISTPPTKLDIFGFTEQPSNHELHQKYLLGPKFPWRRLASASPEEVASLVKKTRVLLGRMDAVLENHFDELLGPLVAFLPAEGAPFKRVQQLTSYAKRSLTNLRPFIQWHLTTKIGKAFKLADVTPAGPCPRLMVPKAKFLDASTDWPSLNNVHYLISHANALLYAYALSPAWKQKYALARWQQELATQNPLQLLINVAGGHDGSTRWIAHAIPGPSVEAQELPSQPALSKNATNGVLAFSAADAEGQEILHAAHTISSKLKILPILVGIRNGTKLTEQDIQTLFVIAQKQKKSYVAICELGGAPPEVSLSFAERNRLWTPGGTQEEAFQLDENDPALVVFDHHQTNQSAWRHSSSLELLAHFTGFQMSINQIGIAILDRSGVSGLLELGMSKEEVTEYLASRSNPNRVATLERKALQIYGGPNALHWIAEPDARFPDVSKGMGLAAYPNTAHFALLNAGNLIVHSSPAVIQTLRETQAIQSLNTVYGGDGRRSSYLLIPLNQQTVRPASDDIESLRKHITALASASGLSCTEELLKWE